MVVEDIGGRMAKGSHCLLQTFKKLDIRFDDVRDWGILLKKNFDEANIMTTVVTQDALIPTTSALAKLAVEVNGIKCEMTSLKGDFGTLKREFRAFKQETSEDCKQILRAIQELSGSSPKRRKVGLEENARGPSPESGIEDYYSSSTVTQPTVTQPTVMQLMTSDAWSKDDFSGYTLHSLCNDWFIHVLHKRGNSWSAKVQDTSRCIKIMHYVTEYVSICIKEETVLTPPMFVKNLAKRPSSRTISDQDLKLLFRTWDNKNKNTQEYIEWTRLVFDTTSLIANCFFAYLDSIFV